MERRNLPMMPRKIFKEKDRSKKKDRKSMHRQKSVGPSDTEETSEEEVVDTGKKVAMDVPIEELNE